jgi:hypothetical protein
MSWVALLISAWVGFILGYALCAIVSINAEELDD